MHIPQIHLSNLFAAISLALGAMPAVGAIVVTQAGEDHVSGQCSLREAVQSANTWVAPAGTNCEAGTPGGSQILVPFQRIELQQGSLAPAGTVSITGTLAARTVITRAAGAPPFSIIHRVQLFGSSNCILEHLEISDGNAPQGAGIWSEGQLLLIDSKVSGNTSSGNGGGILASGSDGPLRLLDSSVSDNNAGGDGGGIFTSVQLILDRSTVAYNSSQGDGGGGGVYATGLTSVGASNSTIAGNATHGATLGAGNGGGLFLGDYTIGQFQNSTITNNSTNGNAAGAGIYCSATGDVFGTTRLTLVSSLVSRNVSGKYERNIAAPGALTVAGNRDLIGPTSADITLPADTLNCDARMSVLAANGGPTETIALATGSCAIDQGIDNGLPTDQRGSGFLRSAGVRADIGAFEVDPDRIFANGLDPGG